MEKYNQTNPFWGGQDGHEEDLFSDPVSPNLEWRGVSGDIDREAGEFCDKFQGLALSLDEESYIHNSFIGDNIIKVG
jgi:hypothetical protein